MQLSNAGTLAGALSVQQLDVVDQPGSNGGKLSNAVPLDVQDVTGGSAVPVFAGQLAAFGTRALGNIAPGAARTYRFTASLPDSGAPPSPTSGDNAYEGSALTVRYSWTATAPDPGDGGGTGGGGSGGGGGRRPHGFSLVSVNSKKVLKRGVLDVMATCDRACTVSAFAQLPKAKGSRKIVRTARRTATLTVPGKAARIRLKLSRKSKRQLQRALRKKRKVVLRVTAQRGRGERRAREGLQQEGRRQAAEAPLAGRLRDRLLELALAVGALDPRGDLAGAVEHEQPRLGPEVERGHLRADALVDAVVPVDLHVDELHVVAGAGLHLLGHVHHRPAHAALAELGRREQQHHGLLAEHVGEVVVVHR